MTAPGEDTGESDTGDLLDFLDSSPSPWHAVESATARLVRAGFQPLSGTATWSDVPAAGFVVRGGSLIAWRRGHNPSPAATLRIVGAHTDSPGLRVKPRPDSGLLGWRQLGVEVYGGALLNSWLDRDLGIAGRIALAGGSFADVVVKAPVCRVPQLAIHLDRDVNERGVVLDKQLHLSPVWGTGTATDGDFAAWLSVQADVPVGDIAGWELCLFDLSPATVLGADASLIASARLDNQVSCWAAVDALCAAEPNECTAVIALFDHEEVGSASTTGAAGPLLEQVLERLALASGADRGQFLTQLAGSSCVSADGAHAVHPNYPERHDPDHRPQVNHGPAIKLNSNQRYATTAATAAMLQRVFDSAEVPWQLFVSRNNVPCGSTIGPITATRLGIDTVDVGVAQLSMHSARELCGAQDPGWFAIGLSHYLSE
ncbi:MAG: M18 family aminopeptidase [Ilumatobacteraceae bacterium]